MDEILLVNAYLDGDQIVAVERTPDGGTRTRRVRAEYVSYHRGSEVSEETRRVLRSHRVVRAVADEGEWLRVSWLDREVRRKICSSSNADGVENPFFGTSQVFEGDVHPVTRWMVDNNARTTRPTRGYFDLETDSRVPFSRAREGGARILSWAVVDEKGKSWSDVLASEDDEAERALIEAFWKCIAPFEQMCAWNGDGFDFPVLEGRIRETRARARMKSKLWLDHLACYKRMHRDADSGDDKTSMKLQDVAMALLGEGKDDFDGSKTWQAWEAGGEERARLVRYNIQDTALLPKIEAHTGYLELFQSLAEASGVLPDSRGLHPTQQVDGFLLRLGREQGHRFPTKEFDPTVEQFKGAFVMEPAAHGIEKDVHVADFKRLYPSIMITWNMSPETKSRTCPVNGPIPAGVCRAPTTRIGFETERLGMLPAALLKLIKLRDYWDAQKASLPPGTSEAAHADRMVAAYKASINSFYGVIGSVWSRYFDKEIAESITQTGVWLAKRMREEAERRGWKIIYMHTDSAFVVGPSVDEFRTFVGWCNTELYPPLVADAQCVTNDIHLTYEKQFSLLVMASANRYVGRWAHAKGKAAKPGSKPEIKGFEYRRGDSARLARGLQESVIKLVVGDWAPAHAPKGAEDLTYDPPTTDLATYHELVAEMQRRVLEDELSQRDVVISKTLTKELGKYIVRKKKDGGAVAEARHVAVARELAKKGAEVSEGTRIGYVVLDAAQSPSLVIAAEDYDGVCDRHYYWEKVVWPPTERFLVAAFPDHDWSTWAKTRVTPSTRRKAAQLKQGKLFGDAHEVAPGSVPAMTSAVYAIEVGEGVDKAGLEALNALCLEHPGTRPLELHVHTPTGVVVLACERRVDGSARLATRVAQLLVRARHKVREGERPDAPSPICRDVREFYERGAEYAYA